jgi:hypothetical protein
MVMSRMVMSRMVDFWLNSSPEGVIQMRWIVRLLVFGATVNVLGQLIYSALGQPIGTPTGNYGLLLYGFLCGAAILAIGIRQSWALPLSHGFTGAILGFYHGGMLTGKSLLWAAIGAILGGLIGFWLTGWCKRGSTFGFLRWLQLITATALTSARFATTWAAAFASGAIGCMSLSAGQGWGLILIGLGLFFVYNGSKIFWQDRLFPVE